uniref:Uncharacterized protein n=1 Tax=Anguilla anguilla TaxID=7936 RepID=A0A0E9RP29_ANGAN
MRTASRFKSVTLIHYGKRFTEGGSSCCSSSSPQVTLMPPDVTHGHDLVIEQYHPPFSVDLVSAVFFT